MDKNQILSKFIEQKELMEDRIQNGIEANRKGYFKINLCDENGQPVKGAKISIRQKSHEFQFGCNIFKLGCFAKDEDNARYEERFKKLFNLAVTPLYWDDFEPEDGLPRFEKDSLFIDRRIPPELALEFCQKNGIAVKGHPLFWQVMLPKWLPDDYEQMKPYWDRRLKEISERYDGVFESFDCVNECTSVPLEVYEPKKGESYRNVKPISGKYPEYAFEQTAHYFRKSRLVLNETAAPWGQFRKELSPYYLLAENLLLKGAKIDTIGLQYHNFVKPEHWHYCADVEYNPFHVYNVMDCYAGLGKPLSVSEITIPGYDEEIQAEIVKNMYSIWFSHPAMESIVYWNLGDNCAISGADREGWNEDTYQSGLVKSDFTEKASYQVLDQLINQEWRTNLELSTKEDYAWFKAFYGDYEVTAMANGKKVTRDLKLTKNGWQVFQFVIS